MYIFTGIITKHALLYFTCTLWSITFQQIFLKDKLLCHHMLKIKNFPNRALSWPPMYILVKHTTCGSSKFAKLVTVMIKCRPVVRGGAPGVNSSMIAAIAWRLAIGRLSHFNHCCWLGNHVEPLIHNEDDWKNYIILGDWIWQNQSSMHIQF